MFESLTQPNYPKAALGLERDSITALSLRSEGRGRFAVNQAATIDLPEGLLTPSFTDRNISDAGEMAALLDEVLTASGLMKQTRWSVALPSNSARTAILTIDNEPVSREELGEMLEWKAENTFGAPSSELRISRRKLKNDAQGRSRFFATAVKLTVLDEFETLFESLGWHCGLILPRALSEAKWLSGADGVNDSLLISAQADGFVALLMRGGEVSVVRSVTCTDAERDDEIYRLLMFYRDRLGKAAGDTFLENVLIIGRELTPERLAKIADEALGTRLRILRPADVGLEMPGGQLDFFDLAAPAGLASLGCR